MNIMIFDYDYDNKDDDHTHFGQPSTRQCKRDPHSCNSQSEYDKLAKYAILSTSNMNMTNCTTYEI